MVMTPPGRLPLAPPREAAARTRRGRLACLAGREVRAAPGECALAPRPAGRAARPERRPGN